MVVRGRIGEVCQSSGCWFVLQDVSDGKLHQIMVDLTPAAEFTVPGGVRGKRARVMGRLMGKAPDQRLNATGVVLE